MVKAIQKKNIEKDGLMFSIKEKEDRRRGGGGGGEIFLNMCILVCKQKYDCVAFLCRVVSMEGKHPCIAQSLHTHTNTYIHICIYTCARHTCI